MDVTKGNNYGSMESYLGRNYKNEYGLGYFVATTIRMIMLEAVATKEGDIERVFVWPQLKREDIERVFAWLQLKRGDIKRVFVWPQLKIRDIEKVFVWSPL